MIRVLVADDEPVAREGLREILERDPEIEVVGEAATGDEAVRAIRKLRPELVFLDIQMPDLDGFGVLDRLGDEAPVVVFVTAYDEHAVRAFQVAALDYVVKPFGERRLREALVRAKDRVREGSALAAGAAFARAVEELGRGEATAAPHEDAVPERIAVRRGGETVLLDPAEIDWVEAAGDYVEVHAGGAELLLDSTLRALERRLGPRFVRIHRSTVVNADRIRSLRHESHGDYRVVLRDGTSLRLSRTRRQALERAIGPIG